MERLGLGSEPGRESMTERVAAARAELVALRDEVSAGKKVLANVPEGEQKEGFAKEVDALLERLASLDAEVTDIEREQSAS